MNTWTPGPRTAKVGYFVALLAGLATILTLVFKFRGGDTSTSTSLQQTTNGPSSGGISGHYDINATDDYEFSRYDHDRSTANNSRSDQPGSRC
ncbi:MAG TPA: hypothetical protein VM848_08775 [Acidimicrobiia bacterium]|nr:hypothetical protein [Acidimicrobiia bacterium]